VATDLVTSSISTRFAALLVGPQIVLALLSIVLIALGWVDRNPFWSPTILTLSEATALRDQAAALLLLENGADPHLQYPIRAGLTAEHEMMLTPMQAAVREDRAEMVALLLAHGLKTDVGQVCEWLGLATGGNKQEVMTYLRGRFPIESATCASQAASEGR
jgi:ankyrin repeat protein